MPNIRIKDIPTTASATSSTDFIGIDGATNGTRKLNAYSPTFGGNLTVSGTGLSSVAGALNVTGALLAHQTAAVNLAYEGSSISQLVTYGADASTLGRLKVVLRKAGTSTDAVTAADFTSTAATLAGNLTVSGGRVTCNSTSDIRNFVASGNLSEVGFQWANTGTGAKTYTAWSLANSSGLGANGSWILRNETDGITPISIAPTTGNITLAGNLTVSGGTVTGGTSGLSLASGGTNQNVTLVPSGNGLVSITGGTGTQTVGFNKSGGNNFYLSVVSSADESLRFQNSGGTNLVEFNKNGNVLVGTTIDGGQKLQVNGTGSIKDSILVASSTDSTNYYFKASANYNYGKAFSLEVRGGGASLGDIFTWADSAGLTLNSLTGSNLTLKTSNATALTLDSSQRCILAGALRLNNAYTAGAPTATGYVTLQDSAGNTYKVLVGT